MPRERPETDPEFNEIFAALYNELHRLALLIRRSQPHATMSATDLVNEAYLKLQRSSSTLTRDRLHLKRIAACAMRQILLDAADRRNSESHGGLIEFVSLSHDVIGTPKTNAHIFDLHRALDGLAVVKPRVAEIVEMKYFGGFAVDEIHQYVGLSDATVERDLREALSWLKMMLNPQNPKPE